MVGTAFSVLGEEPATVQQDAPWSSLIGVWVAIAGITLMFATRGNRSRRGLFWLGLVMMVGGFVALFAGLLTMPT